MQIPALYLTVPVLMPDNLIEQDGVEAILHQISERIRYVFLYLILYFYFSIPVAYLRNQADEFYSWFTIHAINKSISELALYVIPTIKRKRHPPLPVYAAGEDDR